MIRFVVLTGALFAFWLALSGSTRPAHILLGLACGATVAWLHTRPRDHGQEPFPWMRFLFYVPWLLVRIVRSAWHVSTIVLRPKLAIAPRLLEHRMTLQDDPAVVLMCNSITLTPGTITVDLEAGTLLIHALDLASAEDLVSGRLESRIARVFRPEKRHP